VTTRAQAATLASAVLHCIAVRRTSYLRKHTKGLVLIRGSQYICVTEHRVELVFEQQVAPTGEISRSSEHHITIISESIKVIDKAGLGECVRHIVLRCKFLSACRAIHDRQNECC